MRIEPTDDRIVIESERAADQTKGGILLPDSAKKRPQSAKVVAAGPGAMAFTGKRLPMQVKVGDTVFYNAFAGQEVEVNGKTFVILQGSEVLGRLVKDHLD